MAEGHQDAGRDQSDGGLGSFQPNTKWAIRYPAAEKRARYQLLSTRPLSLRRFRQLIGAGHNSGCARYGRGHGAHKSTMDLWSLKLSLHLCTPPLGGITCLWGQIACPSRLASSNTLASNRSASFIQPSRTPNKATRAASHPPRSPAPGPSVPRLGRARQRAAAAGAARAIG